MNDIMPYGGMVLRDHTNIPKDVILCILQYARNIVLPKRNVAYNLTQFNNNMGRYWNKLIINNDYPDTRRFKRQTIEEYPRRTYITIEASRSQRYKYNYNRQKKHVKVYTHYPSVLNKKRNKQIERWILYRY